MEIKSPTQPHSFASHGIRFVSTLYVKSESAEHKAVMNSECMKTLLNFSTMALPSAALGVFPSQSVADYDDDGARQSDRAMRNARKARLTPPLKLTIRTPAAGLFLGLSVLVSASQAGPQITDIKLAAQPGTTNRVATVRHTANPY